MNLKNKLFGDRAFYKYVLALSVPMMIQNGITHLVSMLDNLMIGVVGKVEMNGVYIANQLLFVFNLCISVRWRVPASSALSSPVKKTIRASPRPCASNYTSAPY